MRRSDSSGFTLVELVVTIAIVAVLLAIGLPSFRGTLQSNRIATYNNQLLAAIALARSEAMRSTHGAQLCAANATSTGCDNSRLDWGNSGWLVWVNNDVNPAFGTGDAIVRVIQPDPQITLAVDAAAAGQSQIAFDNRGRPVAGARVFTVTPTGCTAGRQFVRMVAMNASGQVSSTKQACP